MTRNVLAGYYAHDHFALGALVEDAGGEQRGVGIGRFIRLPDEPEVAEPAITVADELQGKGLGRKLLNRLVSAARERGIERFRAEFLTANSGVRALLDDFAEGAVIVDHGETVTMEFALPDPSLGEQFVDAIRGSELYRAFAGVASGLLEES